MIQITPQMRILVALEAVDGRKGIDSLARLCQERLQANPFSGHLFVFRSRRAAGRSTSSWCGGWITGAGRSRICLRPCRNSSVWESDSYH
jgi:transposase